MLFFSQVIDLLPLVFWGQPIFKSSQDYLNKHKQSNEHINMKKLTIQSLVPVLFLLGALFIHHLGKGRPANFELDIETQHPDLHESVYGLTAFTRSFITTRDNEEPEQDQLLQERYEQVLASYE